MLLDDLNNHSFAEGAGSELLTTEEVAWAGETQEDKTALKLVIQNLSTAEQFVQSKGYQFEWNHAETLYLAQVPMVPWEGTNIPRSHLGMPLVYEHMESILPQVMLGLFADKQPFKLDPRPGTTEAAALANEAILNWELKVCATQGFREEFRLLAKSALQYGQGIGKWGWCSYTRKRRQWRRKEQPEVIDTGSGTTATLPSANGEDDYEIVEFDEEINHPTFENINVRHILVDPSCRTSDIRQAGYVIHRIYVDAEWLDQRRDEEGYNIPTREQLRQIFTQPTETPYGSPLETQGDEFGPQQRKKAAPRSLATNADPLAQPMELLEYWDNDYVYTVLQRKLVIRNQINEWGKIPFVSGTFTDILDSFWGLGIAHVIGNEQRLQQGVINAFLDGLSLDLQGVFVRKRGLNTPTQNIRMRPGAIFDADGDGTGLKLLERQQMGAETMAVLGSSDARSARRTAASEISVQGAMPAEGRSITRTAAGVNAMTGGSGARLQYLIEHLAGQVMIPVLEAFHEMNTIKLKPSQVRKILSENMQENYKGDVYAVMNGSYDFDYLAAARLQQKKQALQSIPILSQILLTDPVFDHLTKIGKKIDIMALLNRLFEMMGLSGMDEIIVNMTDEDKQAMAEQMQQQLAMAQQQENIKTNSKMSVLEANNDARVGRDLIREALRQHEKGTLGL